MNFIYENILKPLLQLFEKMFTSQERKEFVVIIDFLDLIYEKGGNLINNITFIMIFPLLFFPLINFSFLIVGGSIITLLDILISIFPLIKKGDLLSLFNYGYILELLCVLWNLFLIIHYTVSGMLKVRFRQTKNFLKKPFTVSYNSKEYEIAYENFREKIK